MQDGQDQSFWQWLIGGAVTICATVFGGLWRSIHGKIDAVDKEAKMAMDDIWGVISKERELAGKFRETILQQIGTVPSRDEMNKRFDTLESRLANLLDRLVK